MITIILRVQNQRGIGQEIQEQSLNLWLTKYEGINPLP